MADQVTKSWFCVFNNPESHGYEGSPEEICTRLRDEWCSGSDTRSGGWTYCISADGLHHVHMVLEDTTSMRFSQVKQSYAKGMHFEPTKGTKKEAKEYIEKKGKYAEKGEQVLFTLFHGEIQGRQGKRTDLSRIYDLVSEGFSISEILSADPAFFRYKSLIREMIFAKMDKDTPIVRPVSVFWHTGETGSGKSFSRVQLAQEVGEDNIYFLTTFGSGAFDNYAGQKYLWIEDYRGEFSYSMFLRLLDVYKCEVPARYSNVKALWNEVHITSVLTPLGCYPDKANSSDTIKQLLRRITAVIYHYKSDLGYYQMKYSPYETYNNMWIAANKAIQEDKKTAAEIGELDSWLTFEELQNETK